MTINLNTQGGTGLGAQLGNDARPADGAGTASASDRSTQAPDNSLLSAARQAPAQLDGLLPAPPAIQSANHDPEPQIEVGNNQHVITAQRIEGTPGNRFVNINPFGLFQGGNLVGREFGRQAILVDDNAGHRAFADITVTRESDGNVLRVQGRSEAIKHVQDGRVPTQVLVREFITVTGNDNTQRTYTNSGTVGGTAGVGGEAGTSGGSVSGNVGVSGSATHAQGSTWTQVSNGDAPAITVSNTTRVSRDFSSAIHIPADAGRLEYKLDVTFVYEDGSRVQRAVAASTDLR